MKVADFNFDLPRSLIADVPARPRDSARMLHVSGDRYGGVRNGFIRDLPDCLNEGDLLVLNDTKVIPGRLRGRRGEAKVEVTLHKADAVEGQWYAFARPAKRLRSGDKVEFAEDFAAVVVEKGVGGEVLLAFGIPNADLLAQLHEHGEMPLPPYISRPDGAGDADDADYQTVYAERPGAVAAPTAGLHFTDTLFAAIEARGIDRVSLTLHVGAGTFLPIQVDDVADHVMHAEWGEITPEAANKINRVRAQGGRIVAVGTTSLRLMESAVDGNRMVAPFTGETDIFITPGHQIQSADLLLTNFHLPRSTLFMLVCAFSGHERMREAYAHAIEKGYRFYSYGDACLLERQE